MARRILIIDGHPDPSPERFCHGLAEAYGSGAAEAGFEVHRLRLADLDFPLLSRVDDWTAGTPPPAVVHVQSEITWADHIVLVFPLWLGGPPARLKGLLEQTLRPGFAMDPQSRGPGCARLKGRTARMVTTMAMPAVIYRVWFRACGLDALRRGVLQFVGVRPVRRTLIGGVQSLNETARRRWLGRLRRLGAAGR